MFKSYNLQFLGLLLIANGACSGASRAKMRTSVSPLGFAIQAAVQGCVGHISARFIYEKKKLFLDKLAQEIDARWKNADALAEDWGSGFVRRKMPFAVVNFTHYFTMLATPRVLHKAMGGHGHSWLNHGAYLAGWVAYETEHTRTKATDEKVIGTVQNIAKGVDKLIFNVQQWWNRASATDEA